MIALLLAQTIAITGGTVYPVSGPKLANASVLIRDGRIVAVGTSVSIPPGVTRIDASGKWVTPALAVPSGNLVSGQAVLIDLDGATMEQMVVRSPVGIVADLSESGKDDAGGSRAGIAARLRQVFRDALEYERRKTDFSRAQMRPLSASAGDLEALLPVLHGRVSLIALANRRSDIETALRLAKEFRLKLVLAGAAQGWEIPAAIAAAGGPGLGEPMGNIPGDDSLGLRYEKAALLVKAGGGGRAPRNDTRKA